MEKQMDIKTFIRTAKHMPNHISVLLQGPTGIGKSHLVKQIGKETNIPVIDRRLSLMSEGDMVGLPEIHDGVTRFCPPDWYAQACRQPHILFLDELNRATPEVMQAAFQIVLDRELNGHRLHPQTRVFAAVNVGAEYEVNEMDPALLRRFWSIKLQPTTEDWLNWANGNISDIIVDFISKNPEHLRTKGAIEPGKVVPTPASWQFVDDALKHANVIDDPHSDVFYPICMGLVGVEASIAFVDFAKTAGSRVNIEDLLDNYEKVKPKLLKMNDDKRNALIKKLELYAQKNDFTLDQVESIKKFTEIISGEMMVNLWNAVCATQHISNIQKLHKAIGNKIVDAVNTSRS